MGSPIGRQLNDTAFIIDNDMVRRGPYKTVFSNKGEATIFNNDIDARNGYKLIRSLPDGEEDVFTILEVFRSPKINAIPPHYSLRIKKSSLLLRKGAEQKSAAMNTSNCERDRVGTRNIKKIQTITKSLGELILIIDSSNNSPTQKLEAKEKIKDLITNPTIASILSDTKPDC